MHGSNTITFSVLFTETAVTHGTAWARNYYKRNGMPDWEFRIWLRSCWKEISQQRAEIATA